MKSKSYTLKAIPPELYRKLRIKAAHEETSINKTILAAIEIAVANIDLPKDKFLRSIKHVDSK